MSFKILIFVFIFLANACGVKGRPVSKDNSDFKPFNKIYKKKDETKKEKIKK